MRRVEIDMKEILIDRIMQELGGDGKILRVINFTVYDAYVIADGEGGIKLYQISTNFPSIKEIDGKELADPYEDDF